MNLTSSQQSALDLTKHTAIIANAGSGKTAVLVERYLRVLEENPDLHPRNIVAITFTDSSAQDLKRKISEALRLRIQNCDEGARRERLIKIRQQPGSAYISTIHSFCSQLLRTYPVEASVDASFTILTSPEDQLLREECVRASFYEILETAYADPDSSEASLLPVFRLFGRRKLSTLIHSFLGSRFRMSDLMNSLYSYTDEVILKGWSDTITVLLRAEILDKIDISFFENLLAEGNPKLKNWQKASEAMSIFRSATSVDERLSAYPDLVEAFFTKKLELRSVFVAKEAEEEYRGRAERLITPYAKYQSILIAYLDSLENPGGDELYLDYSRQLLSIYECVISRYRLEKTKYSLLDYDDVIEYALKLVQDDRVQAELVGRFSHILIDEYQDTDSAQYQIARALTGHFQKQNRLTVVGDPKQSIYSFRNADLDLYFGTLDEIAATNKKNVPIILPESFRILSHPLAFINKVSEGLFGVGSPFSDKYAFTPLVEAREAKKAGSVDLILPAGNSDDKPASFDDDQSLDDLPDADTANEVELIALKIREIVRGSAEKYLIFDNRDDHSSSRSPAYADIAILLRSRTHQGEIEAALRKIGVPFKTYGGKGFYSRPEIIDITNYLRFLINANDDIALAGVLRSPYFGINDIELYRLAPKHDSVESLWQRFASRAPGSESPLIIRAHEQLNDNLLIAGRVSTQFLLQKIIAESGILGILESLPDGPQRIANLEKYARFALGFGSEGYAGTFDFIERMTLLSERDEMEAQAEPETGLNAVHLMTIHNAKGLEFPIVFLPYLHSSITSRDRRTIWNTLDKDLGIGVDLPEQTHPLPINELIKHRSLDRDIEEEKRIFYVAMTRARDHLILSASQTRSSFKNTRIGWVLDSLSISEPPEESEILLSTEVERYSPGGKFKESVTLRIPIIRSEKDIPALPENTLPKVEVQDALDFSLSSVTPSESIGRFSPTQLLTYLECPTKYYLRYELGLPEDRQLPYFNEADAQAENVQGTLFGQILHKVLERADGFVSAQFIDLGLLHDVFDSSCSDLHLTSLERERFSARVEADVQTVLSTPIGKAALIASQFHAELQLRAKLADGQMLSGIIDRLYLDDAGYWNIVDFKTSLRESPESTRRYKFQMEFYAYLVSLLYDQSTVSAHLIYTNSGKTLTFTFTEKDFDSIGGRLFTLISEIKAQKKTASLDLLKRNLSHCSDCKYFDAKSDACLAVNETYQIPTQTELQF